jgi:hypothetical protein
MELTLPDSLRRRCDFNHRRGNPLFISKIAKKTIGYIEIMQQLPVF